MVLDDLVTLIENATALEFGTDLFAAGLPDTPDACVAMIEVGAVQVCTFSGRACQR